MRTIAEALKMSISFAEAMRNGYNVQTSKEVIDACTDALEKTTQSQWISVKDRLPEEFPIDTGYLKGSAYSHLVLCFGHKGMEVGRTINGVWPSTMINSSDVTHWMPLPENPNE